MRSVANKYSVPVMDGYVEYNADLDPNGNHQWYVFADDYAANPPSIADNTYIEIRGTIDAASESFLSGYVPEVRASVLYPVSAAFALTMGAS